jgi:predicted dehydrogenase
MSRAWLDSARETGTTIVGLVDLVRERARERAEAFEIGEAVIGSDLDAVLAETRPDVVFDVVMPAARRDVVLTALRHGCHVMTEKPLAATPEDRASSSPPRATPPASMR